MLIRIGRYVSLSHWRFEVSMRVASRHSLYYCLAQSLQSAVTSNTNQVHACCDLWTLLAPQALCEVYLHTRVFGFLCFFSVHTRSTRCAFSFGKRPSCIPFISFSSAHLFIDQCFAIRVIQCVTSCWTISSFVLIAWINQFTVEWSACALSSSIALSSSGSLDWPDSSHIVW